MATRDTQDPKNTREPVARQFAQFEQHYGGDEVNAHDARMGEVLKDNAEQLEQKYADKRDGR